MKRRIQLYAMVLGILALSFCLNASIRWASASSKIVVETTRTSIDPIKIENPTPGHDYFDEVNETVNYRRGKFPYIQRVVLSTDKQIGYYD